MAGVEGLFNASSRGQVICGPAQSICREEGAEWPRELGGSSLFHFPVIRIVATLSASRRTFRAGKPPEIKYCLATRY
jgi:hypothetical protein